MPVTRAQAARERAACRDGDSIKAEPSLLLLDDHLSSEASVDVPQCGLVQERYQHNLYHLVVQAILWNQTRGRSALVILSQLLERYPSPAVLAAADQAMLEALLQPIGLHRIRARRLIVMAKEWLARPPCPGAVYPVRHAGKAKGEAWEIAHLPGVGRYALDSYRIFARDQLLGKSSSWDDRHHPRSAASKGAQHIMLVDEPEWKRVLPLDKDLRRFVQWAWHLEGWHWDPLTGRRR